MARRCLDRAPALPAHAAFESYSVLTRLPAPFEATPGAVVEFLDSWFDAPYLALTPARSRSLLAELPALGIAGGATYDALIAAVAVAHEAQLATLDRRAASVYHRLGVAVKQLA